MTQDEERWDKLFSTIEELTKSNNRLSAEIHGSNQRIDSITKTLLTNEKRITIRLKTIFLYSNINRDVKILFSSNWRTRLSLIMICFQLF